MKRLVAQDMSSDSTIKKAIPLPPKEMGRDLDTLDKAIWWLSHPSNWHSSRITLIKWDGYVPTISDYHGQRLIDVPLEDDMARTVVIEQRRRKLLGAKKENEPEDSYGD